MTRLVPLLAIAAIASAAETERIRNPHVIVFEAVLSAGESLVVSIKFPNVIVYTPSGVAKFVEPGPVHVQNTGAAPLRIVRVELPGKGSDETWGNTGIPQYRLLLENRFARVYNIQVAAGATEPMHTHHDRVVVCLSGATIVHTTPDGHSEPATLTTGQIDWRPGATHVGHNTGKTDLWVVAIEPK